MRGLCGSVRRDMNAAGLVRHIPRPQHAAQLFGDSQPRLQRVLVEAGAEMRPAEPGALPPLKRPQALLHEPRFGSEDGMLISELALDQCRLRLTLRIEADENIRRRRQWLQGIHPVGDGGGPALRAPLRHVVPA